MLQNLLNELSVLKNVPCPTNKAQDPKPAFKSVQARPPTENSKNVLMPPIALCNFCRNISLAHFAFYGTNIPQWLSGS